MTGDLADGAAQDEKNDPLIGRTLAGKFLVSSLLGSGAMGAVYQARQIALDRAVAIKVMHRQLEADAAYAARFDREARAASRLDHPNLIRILDYGKEPDGLFYIAMEFLDGRDLFRVMEEDWPLSSSRIVDVLSQTLAGLAAAHDVGIIHRDLKPENIMLLRRKTDDGVSVDHIKVCDFGIAKIVDARTSERPPSPEKMARKLSTAGFVVGTPEFMSPEQAHGEELDPRSDLYSMGVILYQLLTGRLPFEAETALGVVLKLLHEEAPRPSEIVKGVHADLETICMKAMSKKKADRFADAREMRNALRALVHDGAPLPPSSGHALIANAPTVDFIPPTSSRGTASLSAIAVQPITKPRPRVRKVIVAVAAIGFILSGFAFWKHRHPHVEPLPVDDTNATLAPSASAVDDNASAPVAIASAADSISETAPLAPNGKRHARRDSERRKISSPLQNAAPADPPAPPAPPPTNPQPAMTQTTTPAPTMTPPAQSVAAPPPAPIQAPAPPPFDPSNAHVDLGTPRAVGTTPSSVMRALSPIATRISACYRSALTPANANAAAAMLHLQADEAGFVTEAQVTGAPWPAAACIASAVRGRKIPDVDTGNASADVPLTLRPR